MRVGRRERGLVITINLKLVVGDVGLVRDSVKLGSWEVGSVVALVIAMRLMLL